MGGTTASVADLPDNGPILISHTASDRPLAKALSEALKLLSGSETRLEVRFSTSEESGPQGGEQWRDWIYRQVVEAQTALIVVSPQALGKPWLLWEAGACWGAELARRSAAEPPRSHQVVSIAYGLSDQECPDPLRGNQIVAGLDEDRMSALFERVLRAHGVVGDELVGAFKRMPKVLAGYLSQAREALLQAPSVVNEPNVQDWVVRLEALAQDGRWADLPAFERWMMLAFGRDPDASASVETLAIDVRLHRRLGQLYLDQKQFAPAAAQLRLAWRLAPRDIYVLRPLATASLKQLLRQGGDEAPLLKADLAQHLAAIRDLDPRFELAPDAAALVANYLRRILQQPDEAVRILQACLVANPDSYYIADLLAQTRMQQGQLVEARNDYQIAFDITQRVHDQSLWRLATTATACLALGRLNEARDHLVSLAGRQPAPTPQELQSVESGLVDVATSIGLTELQRHELLAPLRASPTS